MDEACNRRNDWPIEASRKEVKEMFRTTYHAQVMVLDVTASEAKTMPPYFFLVEEKISSNEYHLVQGTLSVLLHLEVQYYF